MELTPIPPQHHSLATSASPTASPTQAQAQALTAPTRTRQLLVLTSSFLTVCLTIGFNQSYGIFQSYYVSSHSPSSLSNPPILPASEAANTALVAFVGTLGAGLTWGGSIFVSPAMARVRDTRFITVTGAVLMSVGFGGASCATRIWHLLLTQGFLYGVGSSMMYFPILSVAPEYFDQHRGSAMGIILSGAGVGGLVLSPLIRTLLKYLSIRWTLRFLCFFNLAVSLPITLTAAPPRSATRRPTLVNIAIAKKPAFVLSAVAAFLQAGGNLVPMTFLPQFSSALGYSAGFGAVLLAVNNGVNSASRILTGVAADRFGRQNTLVLSVIGSAVMVYSFWLGSALRGNRALWLLFVVFYGVFAGGYNALFPTTITEVFGMQAYASVNGFIYFVRGLGALFGSPVGGAILGDSASDDLKPYRNVVCYDGALLFGASLCVIGVRYFDAVEKKEWRWKA